MDRTKVIIIDKDFTEMKILENLFPKASVLLCTFHVIKYLKQKVSGELIPVSQKAKIMAGIKKVIYSRTMKDEQKKLEKFYRINFTTFAHYSSRLQVINTSQQIWP